MLFWLVAAAIAAAVIALLLIAALRRRAGERDAAAFDLQVYRDQLAEVERDQARGVVTPEDAERLRVEISRKILAADAALSATEGAGADATAGSRRPRAGRLAEALGALAVGGLAFGGAIALYTDLGAPGYPDLPISKRIEIAEINHESRPSQSVAEADMPPAPPQQGIDPEVVKLVERLREVLKERPGDPRGLDLLARYEAALGNYPAAHAAQARLIDARGENASAADFADWAELQILAAGGYVSPQAEAALEQALRRQPQNGTARYYWGLMFAQTGRPDIAFQIWRQLLDASRPDAPWVGLIRDQIPELAALAGVNYTLPPLAAPATGPGAGSDGTALPGPSAADMDAAADMSPEERQAMIRNMVDGLADRLANDGGTPAEWARLINALATLGEVDRARAIWDEAREVFADTPGALDPIRQAAVRAGLSE